MCGTFSYLFLYLFYEYNQNNEWIDWLFVFQTEYYVHWSPKGSYLATLVPAKGVILWGGPNYEKIARFPSPGVQFVVFSPCETYLLTNNNDKNDEAAIKVFRVGTGQKLREFPLFPKDFTGDIPPPFLWSHDDAYLARMGVDLISIYESSTMKLLDRRSHSAKGIREFQWSPTANILAFWCPEVGNSPAHVDLVEIPSRKQLRQKNLFNVTQCNHWCTVACRQCASYYYFTIFTLVHI